MEDRGVPELQNYLIALKEGNDERKDESVIASGMKDQHPVVEPGLLRILLNQVEFIRINKLIECYTFGMN
jgi:hypothetical protein